MQAVLASNGMISNLNKQKIKMIILYWIVYLVIALFSLFIWKKYNDFRYAWFLIIVIIALLISILNYLITRVFQFSNFTSQINSIIVLILRIGLVISTISVVLKKNFSNK